MYRMLRHTALLALALVALVAMPHSLVAQTWLYSTPISFSNDGGAITGYRALLQINTSSLVDAGKMQSDGRDIRFFGPSCEPLSFWIQDGMNTTTTNIWVKVPSVPNGSSAISMLYGSTDATATSSVTDVFGAGIASLFSFTEGSGTTLNDWVGGYDMTISGLTWGAGHRTGIGSLSGFASGSVNRADGGPALGAGDFSTFAMINASNPSGMTQGVIGNYYDDGTNGWVLKLQGSAGEFMLLTNEAGDWCQENAGSIAANTWTMIGAVRDAGVDNRLYEDGSDILSFCSGDARDVSNSGPFEIGHSYNGSYAFEGNISLVAIYSTALSATEMAELDAGLHPATEPSITFGSEAAVGAAPTITQNPTSNTIACSGGSVTFSANATGYMLVNWQVSTDGGSTWNPIAGATSTSYTINPTALSQNGHQFRAMFTAVGCSTSVTTAATLNLHPAPALAVRVSPTSIAYRAGKMRSIYATITPSGNCGPFSTALQSITANEAIAATDIQYASYGTSPADLMFNVASNRNTGVTPRIYTVTYRVTDASGNITTQTATVTVPLIGGMKPVSPEDETDAVAGVAMLENSPNPFSNETEIRFLLNGGGRVSLSIYDAAGREVTRLVDETRDAGMYFERWNARGFDGAPVPPGTYFARLITPTDSRTVPLHVVR